MADLNVAVKIGAEDLASGPLKKVSGELGVIEEQARLAGGAAGGFTVNVLRAGEASAVASTEHAKESLSLKELGRSFAETTETALTFGLGMAAFSAATEIIKKLDEALVEFPEKLE